MPVKNLRPAQLRATLPPERIPYADSDAAKANGKRHSPQQRVLQALELGLHITAGGYNIFLAGEPDLGRSHLLREVLAPRAKKGATPPDLLYVHNFQDSDAPMLIAVPAGQGRRLKAALSRLLQQLRKETELRAERPGFARRRSLNMDRFQAKRERLFKDMHRIAGAGGFKLDMDEAGGMTLYPLVDGKRLNEEEFEGLDEDLRRQLKQKGDSLLEPISGYLRKLSKAEQDYLNQERSLERELVDGVLKAYFDPLAERFLPQCKSDKLTAFFRELRDEILDFPESVLPPGQAKDPQDLSPRPMRPQPSLFDDPRPDEVAGHFDINVFVDNAGSTGAPVIFDDHPTPANLMGCIEREAEMGALVTDFTLIKAGSIHRACGGYLILHLDDLLGRPHAWEALLRALRSGRSIIEDAGEEDAARAKGLRPEPVPLQIKVILIGREDLYELLLENDERFSKLFKIKAHFIEHMPRDGTGVRIYLSHIKRIIESDHLLPFDREALAGVVDYGSRLSEDQRKLSLKIPRIRELLVEASAYAAMAGKKMVDGAILKKAQVARTFRSNLVEEEFLEEYDRRIIKVVTDGAAVGKVNGLAVSFYGDFEFGLPHQISCTVGAGSGGIVDLERDAQLGGPIHTKAVMILKGYLLDCFAREKPLVLSGSLGFEQSYAGIEGDSASGAELAALLSALADAPIRLDLAFTGAVGQTGRIMAVGGVTRKIEGFFEVCRRHGLTGKQGVIIPRDNISHLMLHDEVVKAVEAGSFHIYGVEEITEAMELLTGMPAGRRLKNGGYTKGSLYDRVDGRLKELTKISTGLHRRRSDRAGSRSGG